MSRFFMVQCVYLHSHLMWLLNQLFCF